MGEYLFLGGTMHCLKRYVADPENVLFVITPRYSPHYGVQEVREQYYKVKFGMCEDGIDYTKEVYVLSTVLRREAQTMLKEYLFTSFLKEED